MKTVKYHINEDSSINTVESMCGVIKALGFDYHIHKNTFIITVGANEDPRDLFTLGVMLAQEELAVFA